MLRYIKVNNQWIDTLKQQKAGYYYYQVDNLIWVLPDDTGVDYVVGKLQDESDTQIKDPLKEFFKQFPKGGYKRYKAWCKDSKPVSKKVFRSFKK